MLKPRLEIEIKLAVSSVPELRRRLRELGARRIGRVHEMDILFDTDDASLGRSGRLLRVRRLRQFNKPGRAGDRRAGGGRAVRRGAVLTYKGPGQPGRYKVREEIEAGFEPTAQMENILGALGFQAWFRYEKYRTSFRLPGLGGLAVELDETPIGIFLELEGSRPAIDRAARRLGYRREDYITASYYELYRRRQAATGGRLRDMVYERKKLKTQRVFA